LKVNPLSVNNVVLVPSAPESKIVLNVKVNPPTLKNINSLHSGFHGAVQVQSGLVLGGVRYSNDIPKVVVDTKRKAVTEIQTPSGTPVVIVLGGYISGQLVRVSVTQNGKPLDLGIFTVGTNGKLIFPAATLTGTFNQIFSFYSNGKTSKVILRPSARKSGFSTVKVKIHK